MKTDLSTVNLRAERSRTNQAMMRLTGILGLTTGIGVVAWGAWSLLVTIGLTIYERSGLSLDQIAIEDALNQGLLQSAMLIALGAIILELRQIGEILLDRNSREND